MQSAGSWASSDARRYFRGARRQGACWLAIGVGLLGAGVGALVLGDGAWRAGGWPLAIVGAIQVLAGVAMVRTGEERGDEISSWPGEIARIGGVVRLFVVREVVEVAAAIGGGVAAGVLTGPARWLGAGVAAAMLPMLALEVAAHRRARSYRDSLTGIGRQREEYGDAGLL